MQRNLIIENGKRLYGSGTYSYDLVGDALRNEYIEVICPKHGVFRKRLNRFLNGSGCPECSGKVRKTTEQFIEDAKKVHGGKYDYSKVEYINSKKKVCIICPEHGEFLQSPTNHLNGNGCPKCKYSKLSNLNSSNTKEFINKANLVHYNKYDYSKVEYINNWTKVLISCPEHGEFWQTPMAHLSGRGCPLCNESHLEREMRLFLDKNGINYVYQWHLPWSRYYSLDFYLPDYNIGIECQGIQHFEDGHFKNGALEEVKKRDEYKYNSCNERGIMILYFSNIKNGLCITNKEEILRRIWGH